MPESNDISEAQAQVQILFVLLGNLLLSNVAIRRDYVHLFLLRKPQEDFIEVVQVGLKLSKEFRLQENVLYWISTKMMIANVQDELKSFFDVSDVLLNVNGFHEPSNEKSASVSVDDD